jgi:hypothetical protein
VRKAYSTPPGLIALAMASFTLVNAFRNSSLSRGQIRHHRFLSDVLLSPLQ